MNYRFRIDIAVPEAVYDAIPAATKTAIRDKIRYLKARAVKINEGLPNEEMTVKAKWHKCGHDEGKPCEPEQDI